MSQYNIQKIYCITESTFVPAYSNSPLTVCPNNAAHVVNSSSVVIVTPGFYQVTANYAVNGSTDPYIEFTGSTIAQTLTFPSIAITNTLSTIVLINSASVPVSVSNVNGLTTLAAGSGASVVSNNSAWYSV